MSNVTPKFNDAALNYFIFTDVEELIFLQEFYCAITHVFFYFY